MRRSDYTLSLCIKFAFISSTFTLVSKNFQIKSTCSVPDSYFYFGDDSNQECLAGRGASECSFHLGLEIRVTVQAHALS